jgi:hypothetical protein
LLAGDTLVNSSCSSSYLGSLSLYLLNPQNDTTYTARSYATIQGQELFLGSASHSYPKNDNPFGKLGLFIVAIVTITIVLMTLWNLTVLLLLAPLPLLLASIVGIVNISIGIAIATYVAFVILALYIGGKQYG